ncbi:hypothetical protein EZV62_027490 [Acer yangbiense]|uniref:Tf2-1-like SH3-like domain-containing protein n=1 Tax=Acer yangbiense TaxID=1000413 RepID=A0A5C7GVP5_9ROSI|nr:hypothetical protein EZV62_027490 [Acer yangbiense]
MRREIRSGHRCLKRQLQVIFLVVDESDPDDEVATGELLGSMDVSLHSLMGLTFSSTMKLTGQLGSRNVVVLVDSGASHSFISTKVVDELGLLCEETDRYGLQVGNGMCFKQAGVCKAVVLYLQGHMVVDDFFPFELGSVDVVLGITWLRTLGVVQADWSAFTMRFKVGDSWVFLASDPSLCHSPITFKALARSFQIEKYGVMLELRSFTTSEVRVLEIDFPSDLWAVLSVFESVFETPDGLPPHFIVRSDQQSLRFLMDQHLPDPTHLRWITKLLGFDFEIQYKAGVANRVADALSRRGVDSDLSLSAVSVAHFMYTAALRREQLADPALGIIIRNIQGGERLKPYRLRSLAKRVNEKLSPRFYGPFEALARIGKVAYCLKLPVTARIHYVFHVSQLKWFIGQEFRVQPLPPQLSEKLELVVTLEDILQTSYQMGIFKKGQEGNWDGV